MVRSVDPKDSSNSDGSPASSQTETFRPAKYTFKFTLDNTGAISLSLPNKSGVAESVKMLEELTVVPNNETHQNPCIFILGNTFRILITGVTFYVIFFVFWTPLRAAITLTITEVNAVIDKFGVT